MADIYSTELKKIVQIWLTYNVWLLSNRYNFKDFTQSVDHDNDVII